MAPAVKTGRDQHGPERPPSGVSALLCLDGRVVHLSETSITVNRTISMVQVLALALGALGVLGLWLSYWRLGDVLDAQKATENAVLHRGE